MTNMRRSGVPGPSRAEGGALSVSRQRLQWLWRGDPFLTAIGVLMLAALAAFAVGLLVDPRTIGGAPAWLKPAKFAASTAIYSFTLAAVLSLLPSWRRLRRAASGITGGVFVLEVVIIALQAWRGTASHFNVGTPLDTALFAVMGTAIIVQTFAAAAVAVALWRQPFVDRALGWALRWGFVIAIAGAGTGGLMTRPTGAQLAAARAGHPLTVAGAHTVGAPDGGPGLPGVGWSRQHGDLRVGHFVGLHALQALPAIALLLRRRRVDDRARMRTTLLSATSYAALFAILVWQALRGQSLMQPDLTTLTVLALWLAATAAGLVRAAGVGAPRVHRTDARSVRVTP
jgi:hypothetical protein